MRPTRFSLYVESVRDHFEEAIGTKEGFVEAPLRTIRAAYGNALEYPRQESPALPRARNGRPIIRILSAL